MGYDFSMLQRVEDRMQEDRLAAERHRLAKLTDSAGGRSGLSLRTLVDRLAKVFASVPRRPPAYPGDPAGVGTGRGRPGSAPSSPERP